MAKSARLVTVTGHKELDAKLRLLPEKIQKKFVRGAMRKGSKRLIREAQRILKEQAYDTGATSKSLKSKALKRSRKRMGVAVFTDTSKLYAIYESKHGHKPHPAKGKTEPFFYPAVIEFGDRHFEPTRFLRGGLYDNAKVYQEYFKADVLQFIAENKVTVALPKVTK